MPFQKEGLDFCVSRQGRCLIGDEMGLGKTVQAIASAFAYRSDWPLLVVVPSSMKLTWVDELEKWLPMLQPGDIKLVSCKQDTAGLSTTPITVVTYGMFQTKSSVVAQHILDTQFGVVVLDESHYIKNNKSVRTGWLQKIAAAAKRAILLSGTPALARPVELYPQVAALRKDLFGSFSAFTKRYVEKIMC